MPAHLSNRVMGQWLAIVQWTLLAVLCLLLARLIWTAITPTGPVGVTATLPLPPVDTAVLGRFDPFFRSGAAVDGNAIVSARTLSLVGTRAEIVSERSSAIIADADGKQTSYLVGEMIEPGVRLASVTFDAVTLATPTGEEMLFLDQSSGGTPVTPEAVDTVRPPVVGGSEKLADAVSAEPHQTAGRLDGFSLQPRGDGAAFRRAGLQPGDVVTAVDGVAITGIGDNEGLMRRIGSTGTRLTLQRRGRPVTITIGAR